MYRIHRVDPNAAEQLEPLGTKRKFWFTECGRRVLFKAEARGTGDDWAEKIACELAALLGLPHVHYELAIDTASNTPGVICDSCAPPPSVLILGNQLMLEKDPDYPANKDRKYKVSQHTVEAVLRVLDDLSPPPSPWRELSVSMSSAAEVFIGYVMLDAWIGNQDRHHENWGALRVAGTLHLAPTFDHGASLARQLTDEERRKRLESKDHGYQVETFAARASSAFYADAAQLNAMRTLDVWRAFSRVSPQATMIWLNRLESIGEAQVRRILEGIPPHRCSAITRDFTSKLLDINRNRILEGENT